MKNCNVHPYISLTNKYFVKEEFDSGDCNYWEPEYRLVEKQEEIKCYLCSFIEKEVNKVCNRIKPSELYPLPMLEENVSSYLFYGIRR